MFPKGLGSGPVADVCPKCGTLVHFANAHARDLAWAAGGCQGCRAKATFTTHPHLIGLFLDFWIRHDAFPESDSWKSAVPPELLEVWQIDPPEFSQILPLGEVRMVA